MSELRRHVETEVPGPKARALIARGGFDMQNIYRGLIVDDVKSRGPWLVDVDGNCFLDFFASFALGALGFNHPALVELAKSEAFAHASINPTSTPFVTTGFWVEFVEEMKSKWAPRGMASMFCVDSGSEGVESALKAAFIVHGERRRRAAGRSVNPLELSAYEQQAVLDNAGTDAVVVSFSGAFHGRGLGPLSATHSKLIHKADLPAFPWPQVSFPASRWPLERHAEENARAEATSFAELERVLDTHAGKVAAIIVEPVQAEGGDRHASASFFRGVQARAKQVGAAFIVDEVQTGCGATGALWAHERFDLPEPPDLVTFGKKMQLGGFFATAPYTIGQFGRMYQTRNGDRARAMVGLTVLRTIAKEQLLARVKSVGASLLAQLQGLSERHPKLMTEARGAGLLVSFDLPTPAVRDDFLERARRKGVMATYTGSRSVRLRPHLITGQAEADEAVSVFAEVLAEMAK